MEEVTSKMTIAVIMVYSACHEMEYSWRNYFCNICSPRRFACGRRDKYGVFVHIFETKISRFPLSISDCLSRDIVFVHSIVGLVRVITSVNSWNRGDKVCCAHKQVCCTDNNRVIECLLTFYNNPRITCLNQKKSASDAWHEWNTKTIHTSK